MFLEGGTDNVQNCYRSSHLSTAIAGVGPKGGLFIQVTL